MNICSELTGNGLLSDIDTLIGIPTAVEVIWNSGSDGDYIMLEIITHREVLLHVVVITTTFARRF